PLAPKPLSARGGAGGMQVVGVLERLGINDAIKAKYVAPKGDEPVAAVVARGDAEIGLHQISQLLPIPGIDIVGPFPGDLQKIIAYAATVLPGSTQRGAARGFVKFLPWPEAAGG